MHNLYIICVMHFELSMELKQFVEDCVRSGWFKNQSEVIRSALRRMKREEEKRKALLENIPNAETLKAFAEIEEGKFVESDFDGFKKDMRNLLDE